ncbi:MAG TPA: ATP-grasp domain-containing protein [Hyphomicrobium sp.]|nr:ATP-grasp domain-containing protein [Hyphomicrobium sp.]
MTGEPVLIAALSGRGLCASARRAGYLPLVADAFGDSDMRAMAAYSCRIADAARIGLRAKAVFAALAELTAASPREPIGLILGSGFEDRPKLVAALAERYRLIGNGAAAIAASKDPIALAGLLKARGIAHPETRKLPPASMDDWLAKRIGGSGGTHIDPAPVGPPSPRRYYQRRLNGEAVSLLALATPASVRSVGFSRQWTAGAGPRPFRYGGAVGPVSLGADIEAAMEFAATETCSAFKLIGLVSLDFLVAGNTPYLLEVNPRPGATIDVFDDHQGTLFEAHLAACEGRLIPFSTPTGARAAAILYADRGRLHIGHTAWPDWAADRPDPAMRIPRYRPIATVYGDGPGPDEALQRCRQRLEELGSMLYAQAQNRERIKNAEIQRPSPQCFGARRQAR